MKRLERSSRWVDVRRTTLHAVRLEYKPREQEERATTPQWYFSFLRRRGEVYLDICMRVCSRSDDEGEEEEEDGTVAPVLRRESPTPASVYVKMLVQARLVCLVAPLERRLSATERRLGTITEDTRRCTSVVLFSTFEQICVLLLFFLSSFFSLGLC